MPTEPLLGYPYPAGTDLAGTVDDSIRALAEAVRLNSVLRFASAAARTAALAAAGITPGAAHEGMLSYLQDVNRYERWTGSFWVPTAGWKIGDTVATLQNTGSAAYVDLGTVGPTVTVTTDTSAEVRLACGLYNSGGLLVAMSFAVSGASSLAAADARSVNVQNANLQRFGVTHLVTGLTPGVNTFTAKYRVAAGTGNFQDRHLAVEPV